MTNVAIILLVDINLRNIDLYVKKFIICSVQINEIKKMQKKKRCHVPTKKSQTTTTKRKIFFEKNFFTQVQKIPNLAYQIYQTLQIY